MNLEAILNLPAFKLPAVNSTSRPFVVFAEKTLNDYIYHIQSSAADLFSLSPPQLLDFKEYTKEISEYSHALLGIIRTNNAGNPENAYIQFKALMESAGVFISNRHGAVHVINRSDVFYRCKNPSSATVFSKAFFFHTPFELNHKVKSTRFSFNGFPSLYLSNAMIVAYRETRATTMDNFQGVKMQSKLPQSFLDLDYNKPNPLIKTADPDKYNYELQMKGLLFPFLFCCYGQQNDPDAAAPQEYIIPQFFVRWIKDNNRLFAGIKYPSTRIEGPYYVGDFYNLIVPPVTVKDEGFCDKLKDVFLMSDVCSTRADRNTIDAFYTNQYPSIGTINKNVSGIEWNSRAEPYHLTDIGKMEFYLRHKLASLPIDF